MPCKVSGIPWFSSTAREKAKTNSAIKRDRKAAANSIQPDKVFRLIANKAKPVSKMTFDQYKKSNGTTINHFYEKLLLLKELMNTNTAKKIAENRHTFMELFLNRFFKEWEGVC